MRRRSVGLLWVGEKKDKKSEPKPTLGKVFIGDPSSGKWIQLTSGPDETLFLACRDAAGKFLPCVVDSMQPTGLQSGEFPASFVMQPKPHQKEDGKAKR